MFYEMYSPVIQKIEVLRLEKRLDNELLYLRDALPEYSTFPLDMEPEYLPEGTPVPVNPIKVSNETLIKQGGPKVASHKNFN
jgi:large subunit ribosomal protein L19